MGLEFVGTQNPLVTQFSELATFRVQARARWRGPRRRRRMFDGYENGEDRAHSEHGQKGTRQANPSSVRS